MFYENTKYKNGRVYTQYVKQLLSWVESDIETAIRQNKDFNIEKSNVDKYWYNINIDNKLYSIFCCDKPSCNKRINELIKKYKGE